MQSVDADRRRSGRVLQRGETEHPACAGRLGRDDSHGETDNLRERPFKDGERVHRTHFCALKRDT